MTTTVATVATSMNTRRSLFTRTWEDAAQLYHRHVSQEMALFYFWLVHFPRHQVRPLQHQRQPAATPPTHCPFS